MGMQLTVIDSGTSSSEENMTQDYMFLSTLSSRVEPLLRFYSFDKPCATYGYFLKKEDFLKDGLPAAKRPTGGGVLFHGYDVTFSLFIPKDHTCFTNNTLKNYAFVHNVLKRALERMSNGFSLAPCDASGAENSFCFAKPSPLDLLYQGRKCAGGAQRRTRDGFIHQGSIYFRKPDAVIYDYLKNKEEWVKKFDEKSVPLFTEVLHKYGNEIDVRALLKKSISESFQALF